VCAVARQIEQSPTLTDLDAALPQRQRQNQTGSGGGNARDGTGIDSV
jgi:hypothetical protein